MNTIASGAVRVGRVVREVVLTVLALGGVACIVLVVLAFTGGYSLIMFKTGSMSPSIPAGSVALVQEIPASELAIGDVVTVDRTDNLPVTHRITSIGDGPSANKRTITMRGDANNTDDPVPYTVTDVRIVRGSVPHLANVIVWFGNPFVLGGITIGAAVLVTWAFWPKKPRPVPVTPAGDEPQTRSARRAAGLATAGLVLGVSAMAWAPPHAQATTDLLTLQSDLDTAATYALDAVEPLYWHIDVDAGAAPDDGELTIDLAASGPDVLSLRAEVSVCSVAWSGSQCARGERILREAALVPLDDSWDVLLAEATPATAHLRIGLTAVLDADVPSAIASMTVRATAGQIVFEETINGEDDLAPTGGQNYWTILAAPAAVLVGLGAALVIGARRKSHQ
ncbi:signal peptidase I [Microbacterium sp. AK031]|uniref:signal peptidase I n=1 Tax=Microbacterium sp. AK031 TaxID=2723076 RepID=UPI00216A853B|nr:signal peptidase I [Microbacterium sp. AK031]MCS3843898.1 signal peptidase [Microbacterium sp. AK031]